MSDQGVPIFPLRTILFPGSKLPLRIFEPRYLDMISNCLAKEKGFFQIGLGVEVTNIKATGLYSRFNFEEANINPYKDIWFGEDKKGSKAGPFSAIVKYFILGFH